MRICSRKGKLFIVSLFSVMGLPCITAAYANLPLPPRLSANGYTSDYVVGQADVMLPMFGDRSHNLYLDPSLGYGSDSQGYADLGLGYRWIQNCAAILGAYIFGGYSRIDNNARIWVANPGIEAMGSRWDAHLNGYLVMGNRHYTLLGQTSQFAYFTGHDQINNLINEVQYTGNGADVSFAYQLFPQTPFKVLAGGYYFSPSQGNIGGGLAGLEYWFDSYLKVFAAYSYDNVRHSTGALGLGIELGGTHVHRSDPCLEERITDPVQRYLAELGHGSKIPNRKVNHILGQVVVLNNIAFFSQSGAPNNGGLGLTIANCTFENPCGPTDLTNAGAAALSALLPNTLMYFNGGSYNALNVPGGTSAVTLQSGQTIESRTVDYSQLATGAARSTFNGAFILPGNNALENIILLPTAATVNDGIFADGGSILITGSDIGTSSAAFHFRTAILLTSVHSALIQDSNITASAIGANDVLEGIFVSASSPVTIQNVNINFLSDQDNTEIIPVTAGNGSSVTVKNSSLAILNTGTSALENEDILILGAGNTVTVMDSTLNALAGTPGILGKVIGIHVNSAGNTVNLSNSQVDVTNTTAGGVANVFSNVAGSSITANNATLAATASGTAVIANGPNITITNSVCFVNGSVVPCP